MVNQIRVMENAYLFLYVNYLIGKIPFILYILYKCKS